MDIQLLDHLSTLDYVVFFGLILLTVLASAYSKVWLQKNSSKNAFLDHLVMGRRLTLPLFTFTLVATWYGGIFGVTEIAYSQGIYNFVTQGVFWYVTYIIFALFFVKHIKDMESLTLPDLVAKKFGKASAKVAAVFNLINVLPIAYCISLGLFLQAFTGWNFALCMTVGMVAVVAYTAHSGLSSVVMTDLVQFFVMVTAVFLVMGLSITQYGGLDFLQEKLPDHYFSWRGENSIATTFVWGFIALVTLVDPNFYQRCFAARSTQVAKSGIFIATGIWIVFDLCTTFGAMYAKAILVDAPSKTAYLSYALQLLPDGLRGFFLAGILATILSTLDSFLFISGNTIQFDLLKRPFRIGEQWIVLLSVTAFTILFSLFFDGQIRTVWKTFGSLAAVALLVPLSFALLRKQNYQDKSFIIPCVLSSSVFLGLHLCNAFGVTSVEEPLYPALATSALSFLIVGSKFLQK